MITAQTSASRKCHMDICDIHLDSKSGNVVFWPLEVS